ncbi:MAG: MarR family winged helix-turn-helix transcriptional regulator [Bacilli bacterium]|nr:MarR family winged helix-turn-helix transcriptional regulator [Bacilli bacterium]
MNSKTFFYEFGRVLYKIDGFYAEYAKNSGVKENLLWILYALNDNKVHSQKEICETWDLPRSTVNTIMKELESDSYVELVQIKGQKRELEVKLTQKGKDYASSLLAELYEIERKTFNELLSKDVIDKMIEVLNGLRKNLAVDHE